jgi:hypothetical protein
VFHLTGKSISAMTAIFVSLRIAVSQHSLSDNVKSDFSRQMKSAGKIFSRHKCFFLSVIFHTRQIIALVRNASVREFSHWRPLNLAITRTVHFCDMYNAREQLESTNCMTVGHLLQTEL